MKKYKFDKVKIIGVALFIIVAIISAYFGSGDNRKNDVVIDKNSYIEFIDCGQGDSSLLVSDDSAMLIDATTQSEQEKVIDHLKKRGIKKIDHFVLTHPHEDHIGGAVAILNEFEVETIYMMRPSEGTEPTTSVYITLLNKIRKLEKKVHAVQIGESFTCGAFQIDILGPTKDYTDLNDQSIVLRASYEDVSILFCGDQESAAEKDLINRYGTNLKSTILKLGHHGSSTSSCNAFLDMVAPEYAVISCGLNNSYGHPHTATLNRLNKRNIKYYRTDKDGTVTLYTDGQTIQEGQ